MAIFKNKFIGVIWLVGNIALLIRLWQINTRIMYIYHLFVPLLENVFYQWISALDIYLQYQEKGYITQNVHEHSRILATSNEIVLENDTSLVLCELLTDTLYIEIHHNSINFLPLWKTLL